MPSSEYDLVVRSLPDLVGADLGQHRVELSESEMTYYALMIAGDLASGFDVLFEGGQPTCPSYALSLAGWALRNVSELAEADNTKTMLAGVSLELLRPLPETGWLEMAARVSRLWDTGRAALLEVEVTCECFVVCYVIYLPDRGGFGGPPPPPPIKEQFQPEYSVQLPESESVLYRKVPLNGDPASTQARPVQPGLVIMARAFVAMLLQLGLSPYLVRRIEGRFTHPARVGEPLHLEGTTSGGFVVRGDHGVVIDHGLVTAVTDLGH